jgi:hypothetical protein
MALLALLGLIALAPAASPAVAESRVYRCLDETSFTLTLSQDQAIVRFKDGEYRLPRKPSAIAVKYATATATLYLDGDFAAFVADDRPLPGCTRVKPVAPEH